MSAPAPLIFPVLIWHSCGHEVEYRSKVVGDGSWKTMSQAVEGTCPYCQMGMDMNCRLVGIGPPPGEVGPRSSIGRLKEGEMKKHEVRCPRCLSHLFDIENKADIPFEFCFGCPTCHAGPKMVYGDRPHQGYPDDLVEMFEVRPAPGEFKLRPIPPAGVFGS